jgi:hypothetical protein
MFSDPNASFTAVTNPSNKQSFMKKTKRLVHGWIRKRTTITEGQGRLQMTPNFSTRGRVGLEPSINQAFMDIHVLTSDLPVLQGASATAEVSQLQKPRGSYSVDIG